MRIAGLLVVCLAASLGDSRAWAQEDAREIFTQGVAAMEAEEYERARDLFQQAYDLSARPNILVNLGSAQRQLGQLLESRASYERFLEESQDRALNRRVERELEDVVSLIPQLTIRVENLGPNDEVRVDGNAITTLDEPFEINPGLREVSVVRGERALTSVRVRVEPEGRELVELSVPDITDPVQVAVQTPPDPDPDPEDPVSGGSNAGVIVGVTLGVVAVAVAVVLAIVLSGGADPYQGSIPPGSVDVP